jgi:hypothetical protein
MSTSTTAAPAGDPTFVIHSSITTDLHYEEAQDEIRALAGWAEAHGLGHCEALAKLVRSPFKYLKASIKDGASVHTVHVMQRSALTGGIEP